MTLFAAGIAAPAKLAEGKTDDQGAFKIDVGQAPADSVLYVVARGGTPEAAASKGARLAGGGQRSGGTLGACCGRYPIPSSPEMKAVFILNPTNSPMPN